MKNEPAFPTRNAHEIGHGLWHFEGMSLRDYFAAQAMVGLMLHLREYCPSGSSPPHYPLVAKMAYEYADAMLTERNRKEEGER